MKIWHVGASSSPYRVDGVSRTVWLLSREQARLGHDVCLLLDSAPDEAAVEIARKEGMRLIQVQSTYATYARRIHPILLREHPDIVHMHSVFVVRQATLGRLLRQQGVPYLITPHGGLAPQVLQRGAVKKSLYSWLRERPRFMGSSAVALVTPAEEHAVRSFIPEYRNPIRWMPNPIDFDQLEPHRWQGVGREKRLVFLGRFDVLVKGIDILVELARLLPDMRVELYGTEDPKTHRWLEQLKSDLPANLTFHDPIYGQAKAKMLSEASLYLQPSRWEGFPVSVAECMYLGVPSGIADTLDLAQLFYQHTLGLVMSLDPRRAAARIREALANETMLREWSRRGREFALAHFHPQVVAQNHIRLYEEVTERSVSKPRELVVAPHSGHAGASSHRMAMIPIHLRGSFKQSISRAYERTTHLLGSDAAPRAVVLCYHSIDRAQADLSVDPAVFRAQLQILKQMGCEFVTFGELIKRTLLYGLPRRSVACITLDDGYEDNLQHAAPILADLNVPATVFITTGLMARDQAVVQRFRNLTGYDASYLSENQVRQLWQCGFEIGAHTHTHANLAHLSVSEARDEVVQSRRRLEDAIGAAVRSFAYPFGKRHLHYTPDTVAVVRESNFRAAAAIAFRSMNSRQSLRLFEVPRFFVNRSDDLAVFRQKVAGAYDWLGPIQENMPAWMKELVSPEEAH